MSQIDIIPKISICGTDGVGKDTAFTIALRKIPNNVSILQIGKPSVHIKDGVETPLWPRTTRQIDDFHMRADATGNKRLISVANAMSVLFMWKIEERYWSEKLKPDLIVSIRDGYADPAAYAPYYMPDTLGRLTISERIGFMKNMHGSPFRDKTLFLDVEPAEAVRRINARYEREKLRGGTDRPAKWIHVHENMAGITCISAEFKKVLKHLESNCGTRVDLLDASLPPSEVGNNIALIINEEISR